jgi:predicted N-acyltransferase
MAIHVSISRSVRDLDLAHWQQVCDVERDLLMHPHFLAAAEASMGVGTDGARSTQVDTHFWYLIAYENEVPVGAACVSEYPLDTMALASPLARRVVALVRRVFPRYLKFRVTWCGLPISTAGSNLRVAAGADIDLVVAALNEAIEQIARRRRTLLIIYKELDTTELRLVKCLEASQYVRADSLPMNKIIVQHDGFDAMLAAMRSHYRYKITRSRNKLVAQRLVVHRLTGKAAIDAYSPDLHTMYESVVRRAQHRLEILPREFFFELAARFSQELVLTTISQGPRVLAFAWSLRQARIYRNLFVGIDYAMNDQSDAYFNLMIEDIAFAMRESVDEILLGQTADEFKSRLGSTADPRYLLIKVTHPILRWFFRRFEGSFLTPSDVPPHRDVFKHEAPSVEMVR